MPEFWCNMLILKNTASKAARFFRLTEASGSLEYLYYQALFPPPLPDKH